MDDVLRLQLPDPWRTHLWSVQFFSMAFSHVIQEQDLNLKSISKPKILEVQTTIRKVLWRSSEDYEVQIRLVQQVKTYGFFFISDLSNIIEVQDIDWSEGLKKDNEVEYKEVEY